MNPPLSPDPTPAAQEEAARAVREERMQPRPNGPAAAALLAAGIGSFVLGLLTTLAQASKASAGALTFADPVGPLSGKSIVAVAAYLVAWAVLAALWRGREVRFGLVWNATLILLGLGLLGTFPLFYELFPSR